ncbi:MAG: hypothetical protein Q4P07_13005 [Ornithinimicrobium sp.]|uniref:hypothetical protein n=1 Tax=Ornithinimicrobium sp. TaxID=1977084 RepID=UPI0026DFEC4F|nr:hypothetical protein [Ornithinimicrobium sp.]MDO5741054.1 hypothetical protein [Ornithinimicrobium sp.]
MKSDSTLLSLRIAALLLALLTTVQLVLGLMIASGTWVSSHGMIGYVTFVVSVVAAVAAFMWKRVSGNTALFMHAVGLMVLTLVQIGVAEMDLRTVHIVVGVLVFIGAVALATLSLRKPGARLDAGIPSSRLQG